MVGLIAVAALIAAACGSGGGGGTDGGSGSNAAPDGRASDTPTETDAPVADSAGLFLPATAEVTPAGDPIFRDTRRPQFFGSGWNTNWGIRTIHLDELLSGGTPRDGIPSIDRPKFIGVAKADATYADNSPVIQFELNGDVRAYPLDILTWHEIVNDTVGGVPVLVTFCPLCNTAIVFERRVGDQILEFGTSGLLRNSDLVMYDRTSESLWQQISGDAIVGNLVGAKLAVLPAPIVSWGQFRTNFPDGLVLSRETGFGRNYGVNPYTGYDTSGDSPFLFRGEVDERLSAFERVVTLELADETVAYPFALLSQVGVVQDRRDGRDIVVFWAPGASSALDRRVVEEGRDVGSTGVFARNLNGRTLTFAPNPDDDQTFMDMDTNFVWNLFGEAVGGELRGAQLTPIVHANHFWFAWGAFQPDTIVVTQANPT